MAEISNKSSTKRTRRSVKIKELVDEFIYSIDLDADYQREKIWSTADQKLLLDSILSDIDIPKIYLAKVEDNKQFDYECIDGKQRMVALLNFFNPEQDKERKKPLTATFDNREYTYQELKTDYPQVAERIDKYELDFVIYDKSSLEDGAEGEKLIREIFRRLQLGIRLNSGERLKAHQGAVRDFVFEEMGVQALFFKNTGLSEKRFSRQFTLAQICLNSFKRKEIYDSEKEANEFVRARLNDIEDFFDEKAGIKKDDSNLVRIREVLKELDTAFGTEASIISSRAVAVSAYLFAEGLYLEGANKFIPEFAGFYVKLLEEIKRNMEFVRKFESPENTKVMEGFQKYILQASVEPYSLRRRNLFLKEAFEHYKTSKGEIVGSKKD